MKNFGFGCMRLPMKKVGEESEVDLALFSRMIDTFLEAGFTYFDTAHGYLNGKSEIALRECLVRRYPRSSYQLTDKLTNNFFEAEADVRPLFEKQLEITGAEYFDYYLMHALIESYYEKYTRCHAFEIAKELKAQGKIRHIGISFHDRAELLERILTEHPEIEVVQIQLNYADYDDPCIQSGAVYDVCRKFKKPVIVMEPCKGGGLIHLPDSAKAVFDALGGSYASYALRYAASFENVFMVLSGVSTQEQMEEDIRLMSPFAPLTAEERRAIDEVRGILKAQNSIACTACRYCVDSCPKHIAIPELFSCYNKKVRFQDWNSDFYYGVSTNHAGKASDCIACGRCETLCPQHLPIRENLRTVSATLEDTGA